MRAHHTGRSTRETTFFGGGSSELDAYDRRVLRLVILDLDGVVYRGERPVQGAVELVGRLHQADIVVRYATNNSMSTRAAFAQRLRGMGIAADADEIVTSTSATIDYLHRHEPGVRTILAVGAEGMVDELRAAGFEVIPAAEGGDEAARGEASGKPHRGVDAVLVGLDPLFDDERLAAAAEAIRGGARFIATNADARYPTPTGFLPGAGTMVAAIQDATGVKPLVIGKPEPAMFRSILEATGTDASDALVIGDNPESDISAARRAGIECVLVLTGVTDPHAVPTLKGEQAPDHVAADPAAVWQLLEARISG
jgi:phosphoglycolate/pyridoxal phosphate phosphatase family enzyme